ncbi:MAG: mechanosensitive ion channel family protein [Phycisphaerales bacterium]|nr:mechanosensitive ion channel family protein [Phycisphaerales bacterium]
MLNAKDAQPPEAEPTNVWYRSDTLDVTVEGWFDSLATWVETWGLNASAAGWLATAICAVGLALVCYLGNRFTKFLIRYFVLRPYRNKPDHPVSLLLKYKVVTRLSHLVPLFLLAYGLPLLSYLYVDVWTQPLIDVYIIWIGVMIILGLIDVLEDVYESKGLEERFALRGVTQAGKLVVVLVGILLLVSVLFAKSPIYFLSGIGAAMAIILLIFKDTILGLVAGIQLNANKMIQVGDWIQMDSQNADGEVLEVTLTTVRIENWDRTISLVPAYQMISESFINWQGMSESGGRRIKRSLMIDMSSIRFTDAELLARLQRLQLVGDYIGDRSREIDEWNTKNGVQADLEANGRCQTNIGIFRAYVKNYLSNHPMIHTEGFTFLVRQLQPTELGLPIELYVFTKDNRWVQYEEIQADIFDHLLAALPEFGLRIFQSPSGSDFQKLAV